MRKVYTFIPALTLCSLASIMTAENTVTVKTYNETETGTYGGTFSKVSPNGKYIVGYEELLLINSYIVNTETGEMTLLSDINNDDDQSKAYGVSNDGTVVGSYTVGGEENLDSHGRKALVPAFWKDGVWTALPRYEGEIPWGDGNDGQAECISPDASVIGGWLHNPQYGRFTYAVWYNGILQPYEGSEEPLGQGQVVHGMSDDGKILGGLAEHESGARSAAMWVNGQQTRLTGEIWDAEVNEWFFDGMVTHISHNGKYLTGYDSPKGDGYTAIPFFWSEETGLVSFSNFIPAHVADNGTVYGQSNGGAAVYKEGVTYSLPEYVQMQFGCTPSSSIDMILGVSDDERMFVGYNYEYTDFGTLMIPAYMQITSSNGVPSEQSEKVKISVKGNLINVEGCQAKAIKVFNTQGSLVAESCANSLRVDNSGLYIITVESAQGTFKQKICIR